MNASHEQLRCPICEAENSEHATVCTSCGSYIRNKIPTLDLFATSWGILEHPIRTFRVIARAEHKNYAFFLFALGGILPTMASFHFFQVGRFFPSLMTILPLGVILGMILGTIAAPLCAGVMTALSGFLGGDSSFRNALGAASYALVPAIVIGLLTLPIQWLTFGEYQFTLNPHPDTINSVSYWALNVFQGASVLWACILLVQGVRISMRLAGPKALIPSLGMVAIVGGGWVMIFSFVTAVMEEANLYYVF